VLRQGKWIKFLDKTEGFYILTSFDPERSYCAAFFQGLGLMIIDLQSISRSPRHYNLTVQSDWWRESEDDVQVQGPEGPLIVTLSVSREDKRYEMHGRLSGKLSLVCARCLDTYTFALDRDFRLSLLPPVQPESARDETELKKEDLAVRFIEAEKIDLDDIIREQIYLSLPIKLLCGSACAGLCTRCGVNLNRDVCKCSKNAGHPAFLKLKELKIQ